MTEGTNVGEQGPAPNGGRTLRERIADITGEVEIRATGTTGRAAGDRRTISIGDVDAALGTLMAKHRVVSDFEYAEEPIVAYELPTRSEGVLKMWKVHIWGIIQRAEAEGDEGAIRRELWDIGSSPSGAVSFALKRWQRALFKLAEDDDQADSDRQSRARADHRSERPASGFTTPETARQQPPQGRAPAAAGRPADCPSCVGNGIKGSVVWRQDGSGAFCAAAKQGCGRTLTAGDFPAAPASPVAAPPASPPPTNGAPPEPAPPAEAAQTGPHLSLAQQIAITCKEAGITDRSILIRAVAGRERGSELTRDEALAVLQQARAIGRGEARLEMSGDAWQVVAIEAKTA